MGMRFTLYVQGSKSNKNLVQVAGGNVKLWSEYAHLLTPFMLPVDKQTGYSEVTDLQGFYEKVKHVDESLEEQLRDQEHECWHDVYKAYQYFTELKELAKLAVVFHNHGIPYSLDLS